MAGWWLLDKGVVGWLRCYLVGWGSWYVVLGGGGRMNRKGLFFVRIMDDGAKDVNGSSFIDRHVNVVEFISWLK